MADPVDAQQVPDEEKVPLLAALTDLGDTLSQSDIPSAAKLPHAVGAIIKVLEHAGVQIADELYPAEPEAVSRPETAQAQAQVKTESRLERLEGALERVLGHLETKSTQGAVDEPAPADPPPPPPGDTSGASS